MKVRLTASALVALAALCLEAGAAPISIYSKNPHYFEFRGKPFRISGTYTHPVFSRPVFDERPQPHGIFQYDYKRFMDTLAANRVDSARIWINWRGECYARPGPGRADDGKLKYDLAKYDQHYLARLKNFVAYADKKGVVLQLILFDGWMIKDNARFSKYHAYAAGNNVNGLRLRNKDFGQYPNAAAQYQDDFIRKVIDTINGYDNWYFETKNEGGTFNPAWVRHVIKLVKDYEAKKPKHHLVAHEPHFGGYDPFTHVDVDIHSRVLWWTTSNHETVHEKILAAYHNKRAMPVFYDSDGGSNLAPGRQEELRKNLWAVFTAGGHAQFIYSRGDIPKLRAYIKHLSEFMDTIDWTHMEPSDGLTSRGYCLAWPGREYMVYLPDRGDMALNLSDAAGAFRSKWFNPRTGALLDGPEVRAGGKRKFTPPFGGDSVLLLKLGSHDDLVEDLAAGRLEALSVRRIGPAVQKAVLAHWDFDDRKGDVLHDRSGNSNHGKIHGAKWVRAGEGFALEFDGKDDYVDCGEGSRLELTDKMSVSAWIYPKGKPAGEPVIVGESPWHWSMTHYKGKAYFYVSGGGNNLRVPVPYHRWSHVAGTYTGCVMRLYLNGELKGTRELPEGTAVKSGSRFRIGGGNEKDAFYIGMIGGVRVYDRALTQEEIAQMVETSRRSSKPLTRKRRRPDATTEFFKQHTRGLTFRESGNRLRLTNGETGIEFLKTGKGFSLSCLYGNAAGEDYLFEGATVHPEGLWQIELRKDMGRGKRLTLNSTAEATPLHELEQADDAISLRLEWRDLDLPGEPDAVDVEVHATLRKGDPLSRWRIRVKNRSAQWGLWMVHFPVLRLAPTGPDHRDNMFLYTKDRGRVVANCFEAQPGFGFALDEDERRHWPTHMGMQFQALYNAATRFGLYMATRDSSGYVKYLNVTNRFTYLEYRIGHEADNMGCPKEDYSMPYDFVIGPFKGDWYDACGIYRAWAVRQPWCRKGPLSKRTDIPKWLKEAPLMLRADSGFSAERTAGAGQAFREFVQFAQAPLPGSWYGWKELHSERSNYESPTSPWRRSAKRPWVCGNCHDGNYPALPALENLSDAFRKLNSAGAHPAPYVCLQIYDPGQGENAPYVKEARPNIARDVNGELQACGGEPCWLPCAVTPWWRERLKETCLELVRRDNAGGVYLDVMLGGMTKRCFATEHGHTHGGGTYRTKGLHELVNICREAIKAQNAETYVIGEDSAENMIDVIDCKQYMYTLHPDIRYPLFAAVYQDYIPRASIAAYPKHGDGFYMAAGSLFVEGAMIGRIPIGEEYEHYPEPLRLDSPRHAEQAAFLKRMVGYYRQERAGRFLCYGRLLRPLEFNRPDPMPEVHFKYQRVAFYKGGVCVLPALLSGVFRAPDRAIGIFVVNITKNALACNFEMTPDRYPMLNSKTYKLARVRASGEREQLGDQKGKIAFDGELAGHDIIFLEAKPSAP